MAYESGGVPLSSLEAQQVSHANESDLTNPISLPKFTKPFKHLKPIFIIIFKLYLLGFFLNIYFNFCFCQCILHECFSFLCFVVCFVRFFKGLFSYIAFQCVLERFAIIFILFYFIYLFIFFNFSKKKNTAILTNVVTKKHKHTKYLCSRN